MEQSPYSTRIEACKHCADACDMCAAECRRMGGMAPGAPGYGVPAPH